MKTEIFSLIKPRASDINLSLSWTQLSEKPTLIKDEALDDAAVFLFNLSFHGVLFPFLFWRKMEVRCFHKNEAQVQIEGARG